MCLKEFAIDLSKQGHARLLTLHTLLRALTLCRPEVCYRRGFDSEIGQKIGVRVW